MKLILRIALIICLLTTCASAAGMMEGFQAEGYLLHDNFITDRAAGAVNGTAAEPGPGTRTVVDTESKTTISGGNLVFSGGKASPAYGDPDIYENSTTRAAGRMLLMELTKTSGNIIKFGLTPINVGIPSNNIFTINGTDLYLYNASTSPKIGTSSASTSYGYGIVTRTNGVDVFQKISGIWYFLYAHPTGNDATLYPRITNYDAAITSSFLRIPAQRWLPSPLAYDTFTVLGTTDGYAGDSGLGAGGGGLAYVSGGSTWNVAGGAGFNAPGLGTDITNGNCETWSGGAATYPDGWSNSSWVPTSVGQSADAHGGSYAVTATKAGLFYICTPGISVSGDQWFRATAWVKSADTDIGCIARQSNKNSQICGLTPTGDGSYKEAKFAGINPAGNSTVYFTFGSESGGTILVDDATLQTITTNTLFSSLQLSTSNVYASVNPTIATGFQAGMVLCLDDKDTPANFILCYVNRVDGKVYLDKYTTAGGRTNVLNAAVTYGDGYTLTCVKDDTAVRVYYGPVASPTLVGTGTISDVGIISNTLHGLFSTGDGASEVNLDNLVIYARGNEGQYNILNRWSQSPSVWGYLQPLWKGFADKFLPPKMAADGYLMDKVA